MDRIIIKGARVHNLKNIDLELPRDRLVVITGVSGSGKSTLAFDTIYAEGQRRYMESLSAYARQFMEQMEKPDVESCEGLAPAISIEQKTTSRNPRSTVGTVTEVYDYLRLLFSRVGKPHCYQCGKEITVQTIQQMVDRVMGLPQDTKVIILSPIVRGRKGEYKKELDRFRREGYTKVKVDGVMRGLDEEISLDKRKRHYIDVVVDRVVLREGIIGRLADSCEVAARLSSGIVKVEAVFPHPPAQMLRGGRGKREVELLFNERLACVDCGISYPELTPAFFSFNSPQGACPHCNGLGSKPSFDPDLVIPDKELTLAEGAIAPWEKRSAVYFHQILDALSSHYGFNIHTPFKALPKGIQDILLYGSDEEIEFYYEKGGRRHYYKKTFEGVLKELKKIYEEGRDIEELIPYMNSQPCFVCKGSRLKRECLYVKIKGRSIYDITRMSIKEARGFFGGLRLEGAEREIAKRVLKEIEERLSFLVNVGLDYLTLDRPAVTLSGGEAQRIRLATQIGSSLTGVLYILDEPTIGLHLRDNKRLLASLKRLRDMGNTVLVVEHDPETILTADYVIDMGPGAGVNGGRVVACGTPLEIMQCPESLTGRYLSGHLEIPIPKKRRRPDGRYLIIKGARANNLKGITIKIPIGLITCVTGVSGSGKSTLIIDTLYKTLAQRIYHSRERAGEVEGVFGLEFIDKVIDVDQSPIGRTPRSNPATYTGLFTPLRDLFAQLPEARMRGYGPGRFSFNVKGGRCEACQGDGVIKVEMHFLPDVYVTCDICGGKRYNRETLDIRYKGKNIANVLDMTVTQALDFLCNIPPVKERLQTLYDVGLGYIKLGQPATTLSGGEAQRIKLAKELSKRATGRTLYILDEPTTGLHFADIQRLLDVLQRLADAGNTIVIIEHNMDVVKTADHIIDLGPEGGDEGGWVVATGTPEEVAEMEASYTGQFLKRFLVPGPVAEGGLRGDMQDLSNQGLAKEGPGMA